MLNKLEDGHFESEQWEGVSIYRVDTRSILHTFPWTEKSSQFDGSCLNIQINLMKICGLN